MNKGYIVPTFSIETAGGQIVKIILKLYDNSNSTSPYSFTRYVYVPNLSSAVVSSGPVMKCIRTTLG